MKKTNWLHDPHVVGNPITSFIQLCIYLYIFWLLITGTLHLKFLLIGIVASIGVALVCMPLLYVRSFDKTKKFFLLAVPLPKLILYAIWLAKELILANIDVAKNDLTKDLASVQPIIVSFQLHFENPIAATMLANSITLTPGTITIETEGGLFQVHALTVSAAEGLKNGTMIRKVAALFGENPEFTLLEDMRR